MSHLFKKTLAYTTGWVKVRWDKNPAAPNEAQKEEDYRFGVDYEFDVMPAKGGMEFVVWPEGKGKVPYTMFGKSNENILLY